MGKAEILAALSRLGPEERCEVFRRLCELQEQDLLNGHDSTRAEKELLDRALAGYEQDGDPGMPWREALRRIRTDKRQP